MAPEDLMKMSKDDLIKLATKKNIPTRSRMTKADLVEKLNSIMLEEKEKMTEPSKKIHPAPYMGPTDFVVAQEKKSSEEIFEVPFSYNQTLVVLMVRDPYWLYSYWDFEGGVVNQLSAEFGGCDRVPLTLRVYKLEDKNQQLRNEFFDIPINQHIKNWYINVGGPNRNFQVDLGYFTSSGQFKTLARSNIVTTPRDNISEIVDEEWMIVEEDFRRLYRLAAGAGIGESSLEMMESLLKRLEKEVGSGAVSSISSPARHMEEKRHFWLVLDTELIVYGATEPDAKLTIQGQPIKLRPDGSFTLRMALPEGTQIIPVTATSHDGKDTITITPQVTKETH